jgi:hypothetical protein
MLKMEPTHPSMRPRYTLGAMGKERTGRLSRAVDWETAELVAAQCSSSERRAFELAASAEDVHHRGWISDSRKVVLDTLRLFPTCVDALRVLSIVLTPSPFIGTIDNNTLLAIHRESLFFLRSHLAGAIASCPGAKTIVFALLCVSWPQ